MHRRFGASQPGDLVLELKLLSLEFCQPHVICGGSVEGILDFALDSPMLPFQFRQVILQWHVSSSYVISDPDIVAARVWRVEGKICKIESRRCFDDLALHTPAEHTSAPLGPAFIDGLAS